MREGDRKVMRFHVYSIQQMEGLALWHPAIQFSHAIIGVLDPEQPDITLPIGPKTFDVLRLKFRDKLEGPDLFTPEMANTIFAFARKNLHVDAMLVHCHVGLSRSHAIAAGLAKGLFHQDDSWHFQQGNPNPMVYSMILEACK
jgi:predicted protein tyrosine phosphatase